MPGFEGTKKAPTANRVGKLQSAFDAWDIFDEGTVRFTVVQQGFIDIQFNQIAMEHSDLAAVVWHFLNVGTTAEQFIPYRPSVLSRSSFIRFVDTLTNHLESDTLNTFLDEMQQSLNYLRRLCTRTSVVDNTWQLFQKLDVTRSGFVWHYIIKDLFQQEDWLITLLLEQLPKLEPEKLHFTFPEFHNVVAPVLQQMLPSELEVAVDATVGRKIKEVDSTGASLPRLQLKPLTLGQEQRRDAFYIFVVPTTNGEGGVTRVTPKPPTPTGASGQQHVRSYLQDTQAELRSTLVKLQKLETSSRQTVETCEDQDRAILKERMRSRPELLRRKQLQVTNTCRAIIRDELAMLKEELAELEGGSPEEKAADEESRAEQERQRKENEEQKKIALQHRRKLSDELHTYQKELYREEMIQEAVEDMEQKYGKPRRTTNGGSTRTKYQQQQLSQQAAPPSSYTAPAPPPYEERREEPAHRNYSNPTKPQQQQKAAPPTYYPEERKEDVQHHVTKPTGQYSNYERKEDSTLPPINNGKSSHVSGGQQQPQQQQRTPKRVVAGTTLPPIASPKQNTTPLNDKPTNVPESASVPHNDNNNTNNNNKNDNEVPPPSETNDGITGKGSPDPRRLPSYHGKRLETWTVGQVAEWLESVGIRDPLVQLTFAKKEIDGAVLASSGYNELAKLVPPTKFLDYREWIWTELRKAKSAYDSDVNPYKIQLRLQQAIQGNDSVAIERFIREGADPNKLVPEFNALPLHIAIDQQHVDMVQVFLRNGAFVNQPDAYGDIALFHAVKTTNSQLIKCLLESGAQALTTSPLEKINCIEKAIRLSAVSCVQTLLSHSDVHVNWAKENLTQAKLSGLQEPMLEKLASFGIPVQ